MSISIYLSQVISLSQHSTMLLHIAYFPHIVQPYTYMILLNKKFGDSIVSPTLNLRRGKNNCSHITCVNVQGGLYIPIHFINHIHQYTHRAVHLQSALPHQANLLSWTFISVLGRTLVWQSNPSSRLFLIQRLTRSDVIVLGSLQRPSSSLRLQPSGLLSRSLIFHNLIVLSVKKKNYCLNYKSTMDRRTLLEYSEGVKLYDMQLIVWFHFRNIKFKVAIHRGRDQMK